MTNTTKAMLDAFDYVWRQFTDRIAGMTDDEYFWEPVAGCWSLRRQSGDGRWMLDGGSGGPAPDPAPVTTIAWRIGHLAGQGLGGFADRLFGPGTLTAAAIDYPSTVDELPPFLDEQYQAWRRGVAALDEEGWHRDLGPAWGPYAESSELDLVLHMLNETVHHAAEVGLMRDLYLRRDELGR